ncbi:MAG TPA: P1 family peptidase [Dehalococcoidia bacterium]|nr:P1 family peptidase [Dehalococcoidia bacterium]
MPSASGITAIPGLLVGHWTDAEACTGCTVVLCPEGATAGVAVLGGAPGTRETDLLRPGFLVDRVHGVLLTGGSAFGLAAAQGAMRWLEERGMGRATPAAVVPIVVGAVVYDLGLGRGDVRPGPEEGYEACQAASVEAVPEGSVGAGTGATVGKALGLARATKGGIGTACEEGPEGTKVAALMVVNAFGEVVDPDTGQVLAGVRAEEGGYVATLEVLRAGRGISPLTPPNSTVGVVATDAPLDKASCARLATMAMAGMARAVRPVWTQVDGDVLFALSTGVGAPADLTVLGALAARAVERAIVRAVLSATSLGGVPACSQWPR